MILDANIKTKQELIEDIRLSRNDIESLTGLPHKFLAEDKADIVALPVIKSRDGVQQSVKKRNKVISFDGFKRD